MSRMLFIAFLGLNLGLVGCQDAKFSGKPAPAVQAPTPQTPVQPPVNPVPVTPPPNVPTDDYTGVITQPPVPVPPPPPAPVPTPTPIPQTPVIPTPPPPVPTPVPTPPPPLPVPTPVPAPPPAPTPNPTVVPTPPPPVPAPVPTAQPVPVQPPPITLNEPPPTPPPAPVPPAPVRPPLQPTPQVPAVPDIPITFNEPPPPQPALPPAPKTTINWDEPKPVPQAPKPCDDPNGCGTQITQPLPPPPAEDCRENMQCVPPEPIKGQCTAELRVDRTRTKLDILFVVDTSASLRRGGTGTLEDGELVQIGRGMKHFVKNLDPQTDYRIGVMLGHGPATSYHGKLFQAGKGDPAVVDYKALAKKGMSRAQIEEQLGQIMERKMRQVPNESGGAQGEAMMLSLYNAIRTPSLLGRIKKQGLFRDDAALAVVFVTDEQDVCFDYSGTEYQPTLKTIKNSKGVTETIPDPYETRFFNSVCAKAVKGKPLTPGHVYDALMSLKQDKSKLMVNAIVYTTPVPESLRNRVEDENEMGHGIIDLVQLAGNGQMADLANVYLRNSEFATELDALGKYAHFKMKYNHVYRCDQKNIHPDAINYTSMQVNILDPQGRIVGTFSGACGGNTACPEGVMGPIQFRSMVDTRGRHTPYAEVSVDPNALETLLKAHGLEEGKVQMSFWTRSDINPETGAPWEAKDMKPVSQTQPPAVLPPQSAPET